MKSTLIGPQHARFATNGGLHHVYANEKALAGYKRGQFPDGFVSAQVHAVLAGKSKDEWPPTCSYCYG